MDKRGERGKNMVGGEPGDGEKREKGWRKGNLLSESEWPWLAATPPVVGAAAAPGSPETEAEAESAMAEPMVVVEALQDRSFIPALRRSRSK